MILEEWFQPEIDLGKYQEHTDLSWWLLERKFAYYCPEEVHPSWNNTVIVPDDLYDQTELKYLQLCRELNCINTIVHKGYPGFEDMIKPPHIPMFELDFNRPSVRLVRYKLGLDKKTRK